MLISILLSFFSKVDRYIKKEKEKDRSERENKCNYNRLAIQPPTFVSVNTMLEVT